MILDMQLSFAYNQPITVDGSFSSAWTSGSPNAGFQGLGYIDLGATDAFALLGNQGTMKIGIGMPIYFVALVTTAMNDHPATPVATLQAVLQTADDTAFTSNLTTVMSLTAFPAATKAGTRVAAALPVSFAFRRYLRVLWTVAGGPLTAGKVSAFLALDIDFAKTFYPDRMTIL